MQGPLVICYATAESRFDSEDDFTMLDLTHWTTAAGSNPNTHFNNQFVNSPDNVGFFQREAPDFSPKRLIAGAPQKMNVTGGSVGDQLIWTSKSSPPYCEPEVSLGFDPEGGVTSTKTAVYTFNANTEVHFTTMPCWLIVVAACRFMRPVVRSGTNRWAGTKMAYGLRSLNSHELPTQRSGDCAINLFMGYGPGSRTMSLKWMPGSRHRTQYQTTTNASSQ